MVVILVIFVIFYSDLENEYVVLLLGVIDFIFKFIDIGLC